jgi:hypothetical protein
MMPNQDINNDDMSCRSKPLDAVMNRAREHYNQLNDAYYCCLSSPTMTLFNVPPYLDWPAQFCLFLTGATWIASLVTNNVSQVDRLWTFLPTIYTAYYAFLPALPPAQTLWVMPYAPKALGWTVLKDYSPRALLMFGLVFVWMCR